MTLTLSPPTTSFATLRKWSSLYDWPERAERWDVMEGKRLHREEKKRRADLLHYGMAQAHERLERLTTLSEKLTDIALAEDGLWATTVKSVNLGNDTRERVVQRRFNGAVIRQLRGVLKDIAVEASGKFGSIAMAPFEDNVELPLFDADDAYMLGRLTGPERVEFCRLWYKAFPSYKPENLNG